MRSIFTKILVGNGFNSFMVILPIFKRKKMPSATDKAKILAVTVEIATPATPRFKLFSGPYKNNQLPTIFTMFTAKEMYIPITIAMCASQNVYKAISGGALAIVAGLAAVAVAFLMLPLLNLLFNKVSKNNKKEEK